MKAPSKVQKAPLTTFRDRVQSQTRKDLWEALGRLRAGTATTVKAGTKISAKSVALEAGVDRATMYRSHSVVLDEIRQLTTPPPPTKPVRTPKQLTDKRLAEYKSLAEEAQCQVALLARHQYELAVRIEELTRDLDLKETIIRELNERLANESRIRAIR